MTDPGCSNICTCFTVATSISWPIMIHNLSLSIVMHLKKYNSLYYNYNDLSYYLSLTIYVSINLFLSIYLSIYLSIGPSVDLSIYRSIHLPTYLPTYLSICQCDNATRDASIHHLTDMFEDVTPANDVGKASNCFCKLPEMNPKGKI